MAGTEALYACPDPECSFISNESSLPPRYTSTCTRTDIANIAIPGEMGLFAELETLTENVHGKKGLASSRRAPDRRRTLQWTNAEAPCQATHEESKNELEKKKPRTQT